MTLHIDELAPDFEAETTLGNIRFHDWIGQPRSAGRATPPSSSSAVIAAIAASTDG
jgi:hypothetical protein